MKEMVQYPSYNTRIAYIVESTLIFKQFYKKRRNAFIKKVAASIHIDLLIAKSKNVEQQVVSLLSGIFYCPF